MSYSEARQQFEMANAIAGGASEPLAEALAALAQGLAALAHALEQDRRR
jgi:hypothetical protein